MSHPRIVIVSPALASSNNGNWQTAWRWSQLLQAEFDCTIVQEWQGEPYDVMLALHARRSAESIAGWARARATSADVPGLAVVLTGTDLYRDIQTDTSAQASLQFARRLVVLQECAPQTLPATWRSKARVIFQSVEKQVSVAKKADGLPVFRAVMVGHLREEKSPETLFQAAQWLAAHQDIQIEHIGAALDPALGAQAQACAAANANYHWLGSLSHEATLQHIQQAHILIHASRMEGGAHVIMEALCSATPVLASRIEGNIGMLGGDYAGYFPLGDAPALADLLIACRNDVVQAGHRADASIGLYQTLQAQCAQRAPLFDPRHEQAALIQLVRELL
jgi:putative glycosyltransferase (TIGR04348 family)